MKHFFSTLTVFSMFFLLTSLGLFAGTSEDKGAVPLAWQKAHYPLTTCPVSGEELGKMGAPYEYVHEGRLVRFCCDGCPKKFKETPSVYLKKLDEAAIAKQKPSYSLKTCPVSGEELGKMGAPYEYVHEGRLVRFCCNGCPKTFNADPKTYLKKLDAEVAHEAPSQGKERSKHHPHTS